MGRKACWCKRGVSWWIDRVDRDGQFGLLFGTYIIKISTKIGNVGSLVAALKGGNLKPHRI